MFTYITTTTVPSFFELQDQYAASYAQINWTLAVPALGLAVGPVFWSSFADIYGRRLIFIIGTLISFGATIGAAMAPNYEGYMAARFFQGFGVSPAATVGLAVINDMYFDHERGQKIGLWVLAIDTGLLVGPIFGGFLDLVSPQWIQWFCAIVFAALLFLELAFMSETLYPRNRMLSIMPVVAPNDDTHTADLEKVGVKRSDASQVDLPRTKTLFILNLKPVPGMRHPKPWDSALRFLKTFQFPVVVIAVFAYSFVWYWFLLSIITMLPAAYVDYSPQIQGLLFMGLLLGTIISEVFCSGTLSDYISKRMAKTRGQSVRLPEDRLWLTYPAATMSAIGLIIWGISIDKRYHWMVGQVAFFIYAAGIQVGNTCICAYIVDSYPLQSMSVITFYAVWLNLSAFIDPVSLFLCALDSESQPNHLSNSSSLHHGKQHLVSRGASLRKASLPFSAVFLSYTCCKDMGLRCGLRAGSPAGSIRNSISFDLWGLTFGHCAVGVRPNIITFLKSFHRTTPIVILLPCNPDGFLSRTYE